MFGWWRNRRIAKLKRQVSRLAAELASEKDKRTIKEKEAAYHAKVAAIQQAQLDGLVKPETDA